MSDETQVDIDINLPDEQVAGTYADFANIWHTSETFVLDFAVAVMPPHSVDGRPHAVLDGRVVTRVRIPAAQVWEVMKALEQQYTVWEQETGRRPQSGTAPPAE